MDGEFSTEGPIIYSDGCSININRIITRSYEAVSGTSGSQNQRTSLPHISPLEHKRIAMFIDKFHLELARAGCGFQFLELFLTKTSYKTTEVSQPASVPQLFHSSAIRLPTNQIGFEPVDGNTSSRLFETHSSEQALRSIEYAITDLQEQNTLYLDPSADGSHHNYRYEFFRYFCVSALLTYITDPDLHAFQHLGISQFFDSLVRDHPAALFQFIRTQLIKSGKTILKAHRAEILAYFREQDRQFPETAVRNSAPNPSARGNVPRDLLLRMSYDSDFLVFVILQERHRMPLECYRIFLAFLQMNTQHGCGLHQPMAGIRTLLLSAFSIRYLRGSAEN